MKQRQRAIERQVASFLDRYIEPILGGKWDYTIETQDDEAMVKATNNAGALMSMLTWPGERRLWVAINRAVNWQTQNLELSVVHELGHALCVLVGYTAAWEATLAEFGEVSPVASGAHERLVRQTFEEVLDRFAYAIVRGYSEKL